MAESGSGGRSTKLATIRRCPSSTAESTAKVTAASANGTSSVASMTGRPFAGSNPRMADWSRCFVPGITSLWAELPLAQAPGALPHPPPPPWHVEHEPEAHHQRQQNEDPQAGERNERRDRYDHGQRGPHHRQAEPAHLPHDPPVLFGGYLAGVPRAAAFRARPPLVVGDVA